ncbi:MAG: hypothetical protein OXH57_07430 [Ekhidna sp.]|nr:hypothetical protein [Ekhidna sp.]
MSLQLTVPTFDPPQEIKDTSEKHKTSSVFSTVREIQTPELCLPPHLSLNVRQKMDGLNLPGQS